MADDKTKRGAPDSKLISLNEKYEVRYWTKKFGCTKTELEAAILEVGHTARTVERYLRDKKLADGPVGVTKRRSLSRLVD